MRAMMPLVGNWPPNRSDAIVGPRNGIDSVIEYATRSPVPDSRSSGMRVAHEPVEADQEQQREADEPVDAPRPAIGAGEEHAQQVDHEGADEHERRPVVHLAHQQAGAHVEAQVEDGAVGVRHRYADQRLVAALVHHLRLRGVEEEGEVDPRDDEQDEAVERDLAEEERPAVGEDVAQLVAQQLAAAAEVLVEPARAAAQRRAPDAEGGAQAPHEAAVAHPASQKPGPTGSVKSLCATR